MKLKIYSNSGAKSAVGYFLKKFRKGHVSCINCCHDVSKVIEDDFVSRESLSMLKGHISICK